MWQKKNSLKKFTITYFKKNSNIKFQLTIDRIIWILSDNKQIKKKIIAFNSPLKNSFLTTF